MTIVVTIWDILIIGIVGITAIIVLVTILYNIIANHFKQNCYECHNYKLDGVAGAGDCCWYKCDICNYVDRHSMNDSTQYRKCDKFEPKIS